MNQIKLAGLFCLILFGIMPSCIKNTATIEYLSGNSNQISTLLNPVKQGEPFTITAVLPDTNASVRWTIRPSANTELTLNGNQAMISISQAGTYAITADFYSPSNNATPFDSSNYTIIVNDSVYTAPPVGSGLDTVQLAGDQIVLVATLAGGDSGLSIIAQTVKLYNCSPYITANGMGYAGAPPLSSIAYYFNSAEVVEGKGNCMGAKSTAKSYPTIIPPTNGFYNISASLNQIDYNGSLTVSDTAYTFTWPYTSGVTISPLQIKK